jgi:hypothetical protein
MINGTLIKRMRELKKRGILKMKRGMAYVLVVIATACEFLARYLVKGRATRVKAERQIFIAHKWVN